MHIFVRAVVLLTAATLAACSPPEPTAREGVEFNDADVMFAQLMIPHHEQAIEMSDIVLGKDGIDPQVAELATQIKEAQGPEIEQLGQWLDAWGAPRGSEHAGHGMSGMMSEEDMQALAEAEGADAGRLFLDQMIVHHEGAIEMARAEVADGRHEGAVEMAGAIVESQTAEIETMRNLLAAP